MKILNVSGAPLDLALGRNWAGRLSINGEAVVPDLPAAIADALEKQKEGLIRVVEAPASSALLQSAPNPQHALINLLVVTDATTLTIGDQVFEFDSNSTTTAGRIPVVLDADQSVTAANLKVAVNENPALDALGVKITDIITITSTNVIAVLVVPAGIDLSSFAVTPSSGVIVVTKVDAEDSPAQRIVADRIEVTGTTAIKVTGLSTVAGYVFTVRNEDGAVQPYDGEVQVVGGTFYFGAGGLGAELAADFTIDLVAFGA